MKISIITICLNSAETIEENLNSVISQTYKNIEHIFVDGGSTDNTIFYLKEYPLKNKIILNSNQKLYGALNYGISKATGDYILILHSDDLLNDRNVLFKLTKYMKKNYEFIIGSIFFFKKNKNKINRFYTARDLNNQKFKLGLMPPHTGTIVKRNIYNKFNYNNKYKIAGDFDFFLRTLYLNKCSVIYIDLVITRMRLGGVSTKNFISYLISSLEIYNSLKSNNENTNLITIFYRFIFKIRQFYNFQNKIFVKKYFYNKFYLKRLLYDFKIVKNINSLLISDKFIYSALNLAFLGAFTKNNSLKFPYLYNWPDGISIKLLNINLRKIPGREVLKNLRIPYFIKHIDIIGNLSLHSKNKLELIFQRKIKNIKLPYGNLEIIKKSLSRYKIKKNSLVFLTLPTPKQELLAIELAKKNKFYKIICIGGSINMFTGEELIVPNSIKYLEFIWRLRYETYRRLQRLLSTFFSVLYDFLLKRKIINLKINNS
jgi:glycosyltransferase involved in cell wall biosynthesis